MTAETATAQTAGTQPEPNGSAQPESYEQMCDRLWALNAAQYSKIRTGEAARLGIDRPALDEMRKEGKRRAADKAAADAAQAKADRTGNGAKSKRTDDDGYISFGPYVSSERGLYFEHEADDQGNAKAPTHLAGPLKVLAKTEDGTGNAWGILLSWSDKAHYPHTWAMPLRMLAGEMTEIKARLLDEGLFVSTNAANSERLSNYLQQANPDKRVQCVGKAGWCNGSYVTPAKVYSTDDAPGVVFQSEGIEQPMEIRGTLTEWREHIGKPAIGNARLQFAICIALAGPLLHLTDEESGGFHITGASSIGKTATLHMASSVCGAPVRTWRATDNSAESWAAEANDGLLILDELSQVDPKSAEAMAYMLGNGQGKGRANRSGVARRVVKWRTIILSSGEIGMAEKLNEGGKRHRAGQAARMVEFPADAGAGFGAFQALPEGMLAADFARHIKEAAAKYRGVALDEFLTRLVADRDVGDLARDMRAAWMQKHVAANSDGQVRRIAGKFALVAVAGELAIKYGILPWETGAAARAAKVCFDSAVKARGGVGALEIERGIDQVRAFIAANGSSRFENPRDYEAKEYQHPQTGDTMKREAHPPRTVMRAGWREPDGDDWDYFITAPAWRDEVCAGFNAKTIAEALRDRGLLRYDDDNRLTRQKRFPGHSSVKVYHVLGRILADDGGANG
jgi:putative DNA primase/helicase